MAEEKKSGDGSAPVSMNRQQFEAGIVAKAWRDPEYRKRLLKSPKEVVQEELRKLRPGVTLPETLQVYVHEETPNAVHLTLPMNPAEYGEASGDEWMDNVTGGVFGKVVVGVVAVVVAANAAGAVNANAAVNANVTANVNVT